MEEYKWLTELPSLVTIGLIGMMMNFFKRKIKGETVADIFTYFKTNFKSTLVAIVATIISVAATYFTIGTGQMIDVLTVFGLGYSCDDMFNKWEKKA